MSAQTRNYRSYADLPDVVPVFPLPGALLLPRGVMPLNIFEPRYLAMVDKALGGDRLIGMIQPAEIADPSAASETSPALQKVGCLGRLSGFQETDDGRYLISLTGVCRFDVIDEVTSITPYRLCQISCERFADDMKPEGEDGAVNRASLLKTFADYLEANNLDADWESIERASDETLVNAFSMMSPYGPVEKQALLEADCLRTRAELLIAITERDLASSGASTGSSSLQ